MSQAKVTGGRPRTRPWSVAGLSCTVYMSHLVLSVRSGTVDRQGRAVGVRDVSNTVQAPALQLDALKAA